MARVTLVIALVVGSTGLLVYAAADRVAPRLERVPSSPSHARLLDEVPPQTREPAHAPGSADTRDVAAPASECRPDEILC